MLNFGNKEFRNLQEQVLKNAQDIETLKGRENLQIVIVEELPEEGNPNYIYLVPNNDEEESNVYDEYIWLADSEEYEKIGGVDIDLTNYVTLDTEQTITGAKKFKNHVVPETNNSYSLGSSSLSWQYVYAYTIYRENTPYIQLRSNDINVTKDLIANGGSNNLGTSTYAWKDLHLSGYIYIGSKTQIYEANSSTYINNTDGNPIFVNSSIRPIANNTKTLGSASLRWSTIHVNSIEGYGLSELPVNQIASKVTSTFISGTFDTNGESTIDTEQAGTPEGLFIFTYGNCQCFLRLTATMISSADVTPIRVACPMIYNSDTVNGWLNITKAGLILILKVTDGTNHVDSGYAWTLTKTNLI